MRRRALRGLVALAFIPMLVGGKPAQAQSDDVAKDVQQTFNVSSLDSAADGELERQLDKTVPCELPVQTLREFVAWLKAEHRLNVVLDFRALNDAGLSESDELPAQRLIPVPLRALLQLRLHHLDIECVARDGRLLITTRDKADVCLSTRVYSVADLEHSDRGLDTLYEVITNTIVAPTWDEVGGPGTVKGFHDRLIISQTEPVHRQIAQLLDALRKSQTVAGQDVFWVTEPAQAAALDRYRTMRGNPIAIPCRGRTLIDAAQLIGEAFKLPMDVDWKALDDAGIIPASEIAVVDVVAGSPQVAFQHLLEHWDLTVVPVHGIARLTTRDKQDMELLTAVYPVADLVPNGDYDSLIDLITTTIRPQTWDEVGGPGSIIDHRQTGTLIFSQTFDVHQEICQLMAALRRGRPRQIVQPAAQKKLSRVGDSPDDGSRETRVYSIPEALDPERVAMFVRSFSWSTRAEEIVQVRGQQVTVRAGRSTQQQVQDLLDHGHVSSAGMGGVVSGGGVSGGGVSGGGGMF